MRRILILFGALVALVTVSSSLLLAAASTNRLSNGSFEDGFGGNGVALGWTGFNNGGSAEYVYGDDVGARFAVDGKHSQFLRINTLPYFVTEADRYSGIYQTVAVVAGAPYTLTLSGMLRVLPDDLDKNNYSYIVQWGIDPNGGADWGKVTWNDVPWATTYNEDDTGMMSKFTTTLTASSNKLTLFIRALKKWPTRDRTLFVNLDAVSLTGPTPAGSGDPKLDITFPTFVYTTKPFRVHASASDNLGINAIKLYDGSQLVASQTLTTGALSQDVDFTWTPALTGTHTLSVHATNDSGQTVIMAQDVQVAPIAEYLKNGNFEGGFGTNGVANRWGSFTNGGRNVTYGFYDDTWRPVSVPGAHSQLIGINALAYAYADPNQEADRYAGICQVITGLTPQATYYVSANGVLRVTAPDANTDDWSWAFQWGYQPGADPSCAGWNNVTTWQVVPWGHVDYTETPTQVNAYTTVFAAPSDTLTVYFRGWKKWAVGQREFLLNLDNLSVAGYSK